MWWLQAASWEFKKPTTGTVLTGWLCRQSRDSGLSFLQPWFCSLFGFCLDCSFRPELTSMAYLPLFAWGRLSLSWRLYQSSSILCGMSSQHELMSSARSAPGIRTRKPWAAEVESVHLTIMPPGQPHKILLKRLKYCVYNMFSMFIGISEINNILFH